MKRLAIVSTHPIQYNAPFFRLLAEEPSIDLKVFYTKSAEAVRFDKDFGQAVVWDIPLTEGYDHSTIPAATRAGRKALIDAIETFQPDAVLVYGWNFPGHWATMRHFKGNVPVWFRGDSTLLDPMPFWKRVPRRMLLKAVYKSIDLAFHVGQANKRYFLWAGLLDMQLRHAPHAVDNEFFLADEALKQEEAKAIRKQLHIPENETVYLFVGKLESKKQPEMLARAFRELSDSSKHLLFIGSGDLEKGLKDEFDTEPNIHFMGFQNQLSMPVWYRVGDVLCLPSKGPGETWGLAVNEALACGCHIIASDRVGCAEDITRQHLSIDCFSCDSSADLLGKLKSTTQQTTQWRKAQAQKFIEHFNYASIVNAVTASLHG